MTNNDTPNMTAQSWQKHYDKIEYLDPSYNVFCDLGMDYDADWTNCYYDECIIKTGMKNPKIFHVVFITIYTSMSHKF